MVRYEAENFSLKLFQKSDMATTRAERLLCCAVAYRNHEADEAQQTPLPGKFKSEQEAVQAMMHVLWHEAKASMQEEIQKPDDSYLHAVDIDSGEPGIVTSRVKCEVLRKNLPLPRVVYDRKTRTRPAAPQVKLSPPKSVEEALEAAIKRQAAAQKAQQKSARKDIRAEESTLKRTEQRQKETPDEREERLQLAREKRAKRKQEKEERAIQEPREDAPPADEENVSRGDGNDKQTPADEETAVPSVAQALENEADVDRPVHQVLPPKLKSRTSKTRFFASPVPFDRHLSAMESVGLHPNIQDAVLICEPSEHLQIVQGPPGTGKTRYLASQISSFADTDRILCCAPTNVGAANLYQRVLVHAPEAALLMSPSRVPADTPITNQSPHAGVVCCTVSGRNGPMLENEKFNVLLVDEAAQCMEAWFWSLLRPEVHTVVMVGDTQQLPALASETGVERGYNRSLMERLVSSGYPVKFLNVQHRMHPEIVLYPNTEFYGGALQTEYASSDKPSSSLAPYKIIAVDGKCVEAGTSFVNEAEVSVCVEMQREIQKEYENVVIVTPYQGQTRALLAAGATNVHTVDSFQGREADAVIVSMVRCEEIGFWSDTRRLNVALTRARHVLRVVGGAARWTGALKSLAADGTKRKLL